MKPIGVEFREDGAGRLVLNYVPPVDGQPVPPVDEQQIRTAAAEAGHAALAFDESALELVTARIRQGLPGGVVIAQPLPAEYRVEVAANRMSASLTVIAPRGGRPACMADAMAALGERGVRVGIDEAAVAVAVEKAAERREVGRRIPPEPGKDAWLEPLVAVDRQRHPQVDANGHVDYHDLGDIPSVTEGAQLMRRHPPCAGTPSRNVLGDVENAVIEAEQSVFVNEAVIERSVTAIDRVEVGGRGGKGQILGGLVGATSSVRGDCVGGAGAGPTRVVVGMNPVLQRALEAHEHALEAKLKEHADHATVVVGTRVESGATTVIGRRSAYISDELGRGVFRLDGKGEISYGSLAAAGR